MRLVKGAVRLAIVVGLGVGAWYAYGAYTFEEQETVGALPTATADIRDITVSVSATGVLQPVRVVDVKSKAAGEILEMPVETGDRVRAGDLLVQVDTRILEQELRQMDADLQSAEVRAEIAERQYERAQLLRAEDLISDNDLESSEQNAKNAESQLLRAQAAVELAKERLQDATVRAPISGTIIAKQVEEGTIITSSTSNVSGGTTLVQMADLSELEVRTLVDEIDIGQVRPGLPVEMTVEAFPEREFRGQVIKIEPQAVIQQSVTTFPVLSRIDNSDGVLLPGMNAEVRIVIHRRPGVLAVANEAVRTPDDARQVAELLGFELPGGAPGMDDQGRQLVADAGGTPGTSRAVAASGGRATARSAAQRAASDNGSPVARSAPAAANDNGPNGNGGASGGSGSPDSGRAGSGLSGGGSASGGLPGSGSPSGGSNSAATNGGGSNSNGVPGATSAARSRRGPDGGRGGRGFGSGGGRGGGGRFDPDDPDARRRMEEMRRRREAAEAEADDPWGVEGGRRQDAVVFVREADGAISARQIVVGVRDWEYTEVISGLAAGDELVVLPSTSLLRSQEQLRERFSNRGGLPGMGGPPRGRGFR